MARTRFVVLLLTACLLLGGLPVAGQAGGPGGNEGGHADNAGSPLPLSTPTPEQPTTEPDTSEPATNPLRPDPAGDCQLATNTTQAVNVREAPSVNAAVIGTLDPNLLYDVLGVVVVNGEIWYRVEAGWVSGSVVTVDGDCPVRGSDIQPDMYSFDAGVWEGYTEGIFPEDECFQLFNGTWLCQTVLNAAADEDGETEGQEGGVIVQCGGIAPNNFCVVIDLTINVPDQPSEFFEPDGGMQIVADLPDDPPEPCRGPVYAYGGSAGGGKVIFQDIHVNLAKFGRREHILLLKIDETGAEFYEMARLDLSGSLCVTFTHGDFSICPEPPPQAPDDLAAPEPFDPVEFNEALSAAPDGDGPGCMADLTANACADEEIACTAGGCRFPDEPD